MSVSLIITGGFGNGTLAGSISKVTTRGYAIGEAVSISGGRRYTVQNRTLDYKVKALRNRYTIR